MTEIPEHLLKRARERRAALGQVPEPVYDGAIYITPAGFTCSCNVAQPALTGATASRMAHLHQDDHANGTASRKGNFQVIDYRHR